MLIHQLLGVISTGNVPLVNEVLLRALVPTISFLEDRTIESRPLIFYWKKLTTNNAVMKIIYILS